MRPDSARSPAVEDLKQRLADAEQTLEAIRNGEVDAIVVYGTAGEKVYALQGAEHPYRVLVETMSEGAATITQENTILYCNQRFAEMLGVPLDEVIASSLRAFIEPSERPAFDALARRGAEERAKGELHLVNAAGEKVRIQFSMSPLVIDGQASAICLVATDMTGPQWTRELAASEEFGRSIVEQATESMFVCSPEGFVIRASRVTECYCGANPLLQPLDQLLKLRFQRPTRGGSSVDVDWTSSDFLKAVLEGAAFYGVEATLSCASGEYEIVLNAGPVRKDEEVRGAVVRFLDVTAQKRAERELLKQQEATRELSTPVLPVRDRLLIVPLIGAIDGVRARQLTEQLLKGIRIQRAKAAVLDLTGVPTVDTAVANSLLQTVQAAKLLGAQVIVSGISSAIARTLVGLDVEFRSVETAVDLRSGIEHAERVILGLSTAASDNGASGKSGDDTERPLLPGSRQT